MKFVGCGWDPTKVWVVGEVVVVKGRKVMFTKAEGAETGGGVGDGLCGMGMGKGDDGWGWAGGDKGMMNGEGWCAWI